MIDQRENHHRSTAQDFTRWIVIVFAVCLSCTFSVQSLRAEKVRRVIDGDTFVLEDGIKVRLIGIDAPETNHPLKPVEYFAPESKQFLVTLVEGQDVKLVLGVDKTDRYGRMLAYVYIHDTIHVNLEMLRLGFATAYLLYPHVLEDDFLAAEIEARRSGLGMWSSPRSLSRQIEAEEEPGKSPTVYANLRGSKYHRGSCSFLSRSKIPLSLEEASKRYAPCKVCLPPPLSRSSVSASERKEEKPSSQKYWINSNSNVRHNESCRYYGNTKSGYFTEKRKGKSCGICGG